MHYAVMALFADQCPTSEGICDVRLGINTGEVQQNESVQEIPWRRIVAGALVCATADEPFFVWREIVDPFLLSVMQARLERAMPEYVLSKWCLPGGVYGYFKEMPMSAKFMFARIFLQCTCPP